MEKSPEPSPEDKPVVPPGGPEGTIEFTPDDIGPRTPEERKELSQAVANAVEAAREEKTPDWARGVYPELQKTMGVASAVEAAEQEKRGAAVSENIPEAGSEQAEKAIKTLKERAAEINEKAKNERLLGYVRGVGEWFGGKDPKTRLAIGITMSVAALAAGGISAGAGLALGGGMVGWRLLGGAATFVGIEKGLIGRTEKKLAEKGKELSSARRNILTGEALIFSVLIGSGLAGQAFHNVFDYFRPGEVGTEAVKEGVGQKTGGAVSDTTGKILAPITEKPAEVLQNYEVTKGDNLYKIIKANFPEVGKLSGARQTNAIENILADIRKNPAEFGITNPDKINIGDEINIGKIREILETKIIGGEHIIEHAQNLSSEAVQNIESYIPPEIAGKAVDTGQTIRVESPFADAAAGTVKEAPPVTEADIYAKALDETPIQTEEMKKEFLESVVSRFDDAPLPRELMNVLDYDSLEEARGELYKKLDDLFGRKGFLFFQKVSGLESPFWRDYRGLTLGAIEAEENKAGSVFGLVDYVKELAKEYGHMPEKTETIEHFIKKALFETVRTKNQI